MHLNGLNVFLAQAPASTPAQPPQPVGLQSLFASPIMLLVLMGIMMYFLLFRPQQQRAKQHQAMVKSLRRGDTVITSGGLVGRVTKVVDDDQIEVEIADGVRVRQMRGMVAEVRAKGEPVKEESASG